MPVEASSTVANAKRVKLPHVLIVSNHWCDKQRYPFSGIFVERQIASLEKAGVKISLFGIEGRHSPLYIFRQLLKLRREVKRLRPDIVHGQYGTIVGALAALSGCSSVISFCGSDLLPGAGIWGLRMYLGFLLSNLAALRADGLICKSEQLRQALWWRRSRAVMIPNGVDLDLFSPGCQEQARKELGWGLHQRVVIMNVGSNPINKGLDLAKEAMKVTQTRVPEAELCVIPNVKPHQMPVYYRAADVLLSASKAEGSPNVVKEALACNLPVVSTPVGDVPLRLTGVHPSWIVERDPVAIGEALSEVLLNRARSNGRDHVRALSLDKIAQQVMEVYRAL